MSGILRYARAILFSRGALAAGFLASQLVSIADLGKALSDSLAGSLFAGTAAALLGTMCAQLTGGVTHAFARPRTDAVQRTLPLTDRQRAVAITLVAACTTAMALASLAAFILTVVAGVNGSAAAWKMAQSLVQLDRLHTLVPLTMFATIFAFAARPRLSSTDHLGVTLIATIGWTTAVEFGRVGAVSGAALIVSSAWIPWRALPTFYAKLPDFLRITPGVNPARVHTRRGLSPRRRALLDVLFYAFPLNYVLLAALTGMLAVNYFLGGGFNAPMLTFVLLTTLCINTLGVPPNVVGAREHRGRRGGGWEHLPVSREQVARSAMLQAALASAVLATAWLLLAPLLVRWTGDAEWTTTALTQTRLCLLAAIPLGALGVAARFAHPLFSAIATAFAGVGAVMCVVQYRADEILPTTPLGLLGMALALTPALLVLPFLVRRRRRALFAAGN